jgi:anti-sigma regulatory factor (Ser/Thr protein kinase)
LTLAPDTASVPAARRFVRVTLLAWGLPAAAEAAEILVSEVCTNAVLHARTEMTVKVSQAGDVAQICVEDGSPVLPRQRRHGVDATTGRGMQLVEMLSLRWGVDHVGTGPGKVVWFEVPVDGSASAVMGSDADGDADVSAEVLLAQFGDGDVDACPPPRSDARACWPLPGALAAA